MTIEQEQYLEGQRKLWQLSAWRFVRNGSCFVDLNHQKSHNRIVRRIGFTCGRGSAEWQL